MGPPREEGAPILGSRSDGYRLYFVPGSRLVTSFVLVACFVQKLPETASPDLMILAAAPVEAPVEPVIFEW